MLLFMDKPTGFTSYDLIHKIKKLFPRKTKIGHAGTLDPLATGLMIIAIGKDTKRLSEFSGLDKKYIAIIDFSKKSDTWDTDYRKTYEELPLDTIQDKAPTEKQIKESLDLRLWTQQRLLTPFSAKKKNGKKLYEYARLWDPQFIMCDMELLWYKVISYTFPVLEVELHVWSGTYIRSIAHRLWEHFKLWGILSGLRRTEIWWHTF